MNMKKSELDSNKDLLSNLIKDNYKITNKSERINFEELRNQVKSP